MFIFKSRIFEIAHTKPSIRQELTRHCSTSRRFSLKSVIGTHCFVSIWRVSFFCVFHFWKRVIAKKTNRFYFLLLLFSIFDTKCVLLYICILQCLSIFCTFLYSVAKSYMKYSKYSAAWSTSFCLKQNCNWFILFVWKNQANNYSI